MHVFEQRLENEVCVLDNQLGGGVHSACEMCSYYTIILNFGLPAVMYDWTY